MQKKINEKYLHNFGPRLRSESIIKITDSVILVTDESCSFVECI